MPETTTITISAIEEKAGSTDGRAWTKYALKDSNGTYYSTFDSAVVQPARELVGQRALIEYEVSGKYKNLSAVRPAENGSVPDTYSHKSPDGDPDWDKIALGKTRCALWNHFLSGQLAASLYAKAVSANAEGIDPMDYVIRTGTRLVVHAEKDVFEREPGDDGVPF